MRLHVHLQPRAASSEIPVDNYPLAAVVYGLLAAVAPDYAAFLHDEGFAVDGYEERGERPSSKRFKFFVFSRLAQRNKRISRDRIVLNDSLATWQIGSPMDEMMGALAESLMVNREVRIGDRFSEAVFQVAGIDIEEPPPPSARLRGETLSPLFVAVDETDGAGKRVKHHLRADDPRFESCLAANLCEKYRALTGIAPEAEELAFRFTEPPRSQLVQYRGTNHKSWMGRFTLTGDPALLRLAWEAGLGEANSKGFGMIRAL
ncbi:MAG: CRISPR-associated endoribonuclease Cas6 [Blastocatellia bacterium]|nr:CRISPR-associated endoribonuclease Cas6 [Blastocatellia bacterium]